MRSFIEMRMIVYLLVLKITPNLDGYKYLKEAVIRVCEDFTKKYNMTKILFKEISDKEGKNVFVVDRALRHALKRSYDQDGILALERKMDFDFASPKPSAKEVICALAEKLSMEFAQI